MQTRDISRWGLHLADEPGRVGERVSTIRRGAPSPCRMTGASTRTSSPSLSSGTGYLPGGSGWYRAHLSLRRPSASSGGGKHKLRLRSSRCVYKNARVWVNGYHLRRSAYPATRSSHSILTEILSMRRGDDLVDQCSRGAHRYLGLRWFNGLGHQSAVSRSRSHEPVRVCASMARPSPRSSADALTRYHSLFRPRASPTTRAEAVRVPTYPHISADQWPRGRVHTFATDADSSPPGRPADTSNHRMMSPQPELWSDTSPHLYRLTTTLTLAVKVAPNGSAVYEETSGHPHFPFRPRPMATRSTEKPRKLKRARLHEDAGCFRYRCARPEAWLRVAVDSCEEMGCNAVRILA